MVQKLRKSCGVLATDDLSVFYCIEKNGDGNLPKLLSEWSPFIAKKIGRRFSEIKADEVEKHTYAGKQKVDSFGIGCEFTRLRDHTARKGSWRTMKKIKEDKKKEKKKKKMLFEVFLIGVLAAFVVWLIKSPFSRPVGDVSKFSAQSYVIRTKALNEGDVHRAAEARDQLLSEPYPGITTLFEVFM